MRLRKEGHVGVSADMASEVTSSIKQHPKTKHGAKPELVLLPQNQFCTRHKTHFLFFPGSKLNCISQHSVY